MPTLIKPKQAEGDYSEIAETKSVVSGALICASGRFSISDPKKLKKYIDALTRLHSRMKSDRMKSERKAASRSKGQQEPEWKRMRRMCS